MYDFAFSQKRRRDFEIRRWPDPSRLEAFLDLSERAVEAWLRAWPQSVKSVKREAAELAQIADAADNLRRALNLASDGAKFSLFALMHPNRSSKPIFPDDVWKYATEVRSVINDMAMAACSANIYGNYEEERGEDLCFRLVQAYADVFNIEPSIEHRGLFQFFMDEICSSLGNRAPKVGKAKIRSAILRLQSINGA